MNILITGGKGMLGTDLSRILSRTHSVYPAGREQMDIISLSATREFVDRFRPDLVIHTAAFTDVDGCERDPDRAFQVNAIGAANVAAVCQEKQTPLLVISTDYVFNGLGRERFSEFDAPDPINAYGRSKLAGERLALQNCSKTTILRTQFLFGTNGDCFPKKLLRQVESVEKLHVVSDVWGVPTSSYDLALLIDRMIKDPLPHGIYHFNNRGEPITFYDLACYIFRVKGLDTERLAPIESSQRKSVASRPIYSVLDRAMLRLQGWEYLIRPWHLALDEFLNST
jgi:dTDP-4-dehydrorhamnose reductase